MYILIVLGCSIAICCQASNISIRGMEKVLTFDNSLPLRSVCYITDLDNSSPVHCISDCLTRRDVCRGVVLNSEQKMCKLLKCNPKENHMTGVYETGKWDLFGKTDVFSLCGGQSQSLTANQSIQFFASPGYSSGRGTYSSKLDCQWTIDSGVVNYKAIIYFKSYSISCRGDNINIYDGYNISGTVLKSNLCGTGSSDEIMTSTGQFLTLQFTSDAVNKSVGFEVAYFSATDLSGTGCTAEQTLTPTTSAQYVTSVNFPSVYDSYLNCSWVLTVPAGRVKVEIIYSDIETHANCSYDSLEIYDGDCVNENTKLAEFCERFPNGATGSYTSNGTSLLIQFKTNPLKNYTGYLIKYTQVKEDVSVNPVTSSKGESRCVMVEKISLFDNNVTATNACYIGIFVNMSLVHCVSYCLLRDDVCSGVVFNREQRTCKLSHCNTEDNEISGECVPGNLDLFWKTNCSEYVTNDCSTQMYQRFRVGSWKYIKYWIEAIEETEVWISDNSTRSLSNWYPGEPENV